MINFKLLIILINQNLEHIWLCFYIEKPNILSKEEELIIFIFSKIIKITNKEKNLSTFNGIYLIKYNLNNQDNLSLKKNYIFTFIRLFQDDKLKIKKQIIIKEPIDLLIKYIDLNDMNLMRDNITQIYKDKDNEELRYCLRSILQYISWIRKIFILMPNEKVKYLKNIEEIKEKIIYIKDKDLLGYDTANIHAFTFNLYKMEKYGISNNFIYMEDDFFIGYMLA